MRTLFIPALALTALLALGGCSTLRSLTYDPYKAGDYLNGPRLAWEQSWESRFPEATSQSAARNFAYHLIRQSDRKCENYLVGASAARNGSGLAMELLASGLGTGAALASPSGSANLLAAGSNFFTSANKSINDSLFDGQQFGLIYQAVHRGRDAERRRLFERIAAGEFDALPSHGIAAEIDIYDRKCGVNYALGEIRDAIERRPVQPPPAPGSRRPDVANEQAAPETPAPAAEPPAQTPVTPPPGAAPPR